MICTRKGVIEPLSVKQQTTKSASESTSMILRIDEVIATSKMKAPPAPPSGLGGMLGGYGGMLPNINPEINI